jgi:hypothetical protein
MQLSTTVRNSILDSIDDDLNAGTTPEARFFVTGGTTPTGEAAAILLNTTNVFNAAATGTMAINTATTLEDTTPAGNASPVTRLCFYANTADADNTWLLQLGINPTGSPDITMANNTIATTDTVQLTSLTLTCPEGTPDVT